MNLNLKMYQKLERLNLADLSAAVATVLGKRGSLFAVSVEPRSVVAGGAHAKDAGDLPMGFVR